MAFRRTRRARRVRDAGAWWRDEGAQIIGGCCGVTPEHVRVLVTELGETKPGTGGHSSTSCCWSSRTAQRPRCGDDAVALSIRSRFGPAVEEYIPSRRPGSYLVWKSLFTSEWSEGLSCMDVGCGCGILAVQLALNGAERVHAIDIDRNAVANTLANAFRNGVSDRVTGEAVNFFHWEPRERFDLVVASLYQMPVDPYEEPTGHRPLDYWGRNLIDHFIQPASMPPPRGPRFSCSCRSSVRRRPKLLAEHSWPPASSTTASSLSSRSSRRTAHRSMVEQLSDAYHIEVADEDVMVAYLLEIRRVEPVAAQPS